MYYPVNNFPNLLITNIAKGIVCFTSTNKDQLISGDTGERIVSEALGIPYVKSVDLCDIKNENQGWSVKIRYVDDVVNVKHVDLKLHTRFPKESLRDLSEIEIARIHFGMWKTLVLDTQEKFQDARTLILLIERGHRRFSLYEYKTYFWNADDYDWQWSSPQKTTLHGMDRKTNERKFSIHLNDSRLYVKESIENRQTCLLKDHGFFSTHTLAKLIGFTADSFTKLPRAFNTQAQIIRGICRIEKRKNLKSAASISSLFY